MKGKITTLSQKYATALRNHLAAGSKGGLKEASGLGRQAALLRLEILEVAKIHEQALLPLLLPGDATHTRDGMISRAQIFFIEAITPIERTHLAAKSAQLQLEQLNKTLTERTGELTVVRTGIKRKVLERKILEQTCKANDAHYAKLLEESRSMQEELRYLAHQALCAQETERGKISRELHDEIAQSILGIHIRLLMLKQKSTSDLKEVLKEISTTERLVERSVRKMRQFARKLPERDEK